MTSHANEQISTQTRPTEGSEGGKSEPLDFESAQHQLFDAYDLDMTSRVIHGSTGRLHVLETGPTGDGPPIVFVHGTAAFGGFFAPLLAHLDDTHLITFDRPGYGLSDEYRYTEGNIRRTVVTALEDVIDALDVNQINLVAT